MERTYSDLVKHTIDDVEAFIKQNVEDEEFDIDRHSWEKYDDIMDEYIIESTDADCPVYYIDILNCALENVELALNVPELYAFDGKECPMNGIASNIVSNLRETAFEVWEGYKSLIEQGEKHQVKYDLKLDSPKKKK